MTDKTTKDDKPKRWIADEHGNKAHIDAEQGTDWKLWGWTEVEHGPADQDMVWLQHEETGGQALFAAAAVPAWAGLGWHPSAPPEPVDVTKDPQLVDEQAAATAATPKKAASGSKKEQ